MQVASELEPLNSHQSGRIQPLHSRPWTSIGRDDWQVKFCKSFAKAVRCHWFQLLRSARIVVQVWPRDVRVSPTLALHCVVSRLLKLLPEIQNDFRSF